MFSRGALPFNSVLNSLYGGAAKKKKAAAKKRAFNKYIRILGTLTHLKSLRRKKPGPKKGSKKKKSTKKKSNQNK